MKILLSLKTCYKYVKSMLIYNIFDYINLILIILSQIQKFILKETCMKGIQTIPVDDVRVPDDTCIGFISMIDEERSRIQNWERAQSHRIHLR